MSDGPGITAFASVEKCTNVIMKSLKESAVRWRRRRVQFFMHRKCLHRHLESTLRYSNNRRMEKEIGFCLYPRLFRWLANFIWNIRLFSLLGSIVYICITQTIRIQMLPFCCCSHTHLHEGRSNGKNRKWCRCATLWIMLNACLTKNGSLDSSKTKIYAYNAKTMKAKN